MNPIQDGQNSEEVEAESAARRRSPETGARRMRRPEHIRSARPNGFNGKHRRRNKRYTI